MPRVPGNQSKCSETLLLYMHGKTLKKNHGQNQHVLGGAGGNSIRLSKRINIKSGLTARSAP